MLTTCQNLKNLTTVFNLTTINHIHNNNLENPNIEDITKINKFLNKFEKVHDEWFVDYQEQVIKNLTDWYPVKNDKSSFIKSLLIDPEDYRVIVDGDIDLSNITKLDVFPTLIKEVTGDLNFSSLTTAKGVKFPDKVHDLNLSSLITADDLVLPNEVYTLYLSSLTTAEGLVLPNEVKWRLNLSSLTTAKGVKFPDEIQALYLSSITTADGLVLPNNIYNLYLSSLTTADGLVLPDSLNYLRLSSKFLEKEKNDIRNKYPKVQIDFL